MLQTLLTGGAALTIVAGIIAMVSQVRVNTKRIDDLERRQGCDEAAHLEAKLAAHIARCDERHKNDAVPEKIVYVPSARHGSNGSD
jgi:hypothetical protein